MSLFVGNTPRTQYMEAERGEVKLVLLMLLLRRLVLSQEWCVCAYRLGSLVASFQILHFFNKPGAPVSQHALVLLTGV